MAKTKTDMVEEISEILIKKKKKEIKRYLNDLKA